MIKYENKLVIKFFLLKYENNSVKADKRVYNFVSLNPDSS